MKKLVLALMMVQSSAALASSGGQAELNSGHFGSSLIITGQAAEGLFKLLKASAQTSTMAMKDGLGINCYKEQTRPIYCVIPMTEEGVLDLYEIPNR